MGGFQEDVWTCRLNENDYIQAIDPTFWLHTENYNAD